MFTHDLVQVVIFTTYAIQCHLLRIYLDNLKEKLLQNTIDPLDWMRVSCIFCFAHLIYIIIFLSDIRLGNV